MNSMTNDTDDRDEANSKLAWYFPEVKPPTSESFSTRVTFAKPESDRDFILEFLDRGVAINLIVQEVLGGTRVWELLRRGGRFTVSYSRSPGGNVGAVLEPGQPEVTEDKNSWLVIELLPDDRTARAAAAALVGQSGSQQTDDNESKAGQSRQEQEIEAGWIARLPAALWLSVTDVLGGPDDSHLDVDGNAFRGLLAAAPRMRDSHVGLKDVKEVRRVQNHDGLKGFLVRYDDRDRRPALEECISSALALIPRAFRKPRRTQHGVSNRPLPGELHKVELHSLGDLDWIRGQDEIWSRINGLANDNSALRRFRKDRERRGTEALGWYQPFHVWDDAHWGIILNGDAIDGCAADLLRRMRDAGQGSAYHALQAVLWLVVAHEQFHARLDAFALMQELASRTARYLRYGRWRRRTAIGTSADLEEAAANFVALQRLRSHLDREVHLKTWTADTVVTTLQYVADLFAASPPGYSDYARMGDPLEWRHLANQVVTAASGTHQAPIEALLRDWPELVMRDVDVPVFVLPGSVVGDLLFSAPSRRELLRVLRHLGWQEVKGEGKGSHEKWRSPAGGMFPVPHRDPVSTGVFHAFLREQRWTKSEYLARRV